MPSVIAGGSIAVEADVKSIFAEAVKKYGAVDVVVNTAGTMKSGTIGEIEPAQWWIDYVSDSRTPVLMVLDAEEDRKFTSKERIISFIIWSRLRMERGPLSTSLAWVLLS